MKPYYVTDAAAMDASVGRLFEAWCQLDADAKARMWSDPDLSEVYLATARLCANVSAWASEVDR